MAHEIRLPRLGWSMEEGTFLGWLKQHGEPVQVGDAIYELEGEKASQAIEAIDAGTLFIPPDAPQPGSVVPVGSLLGFVLAQGEAPPSAVNTERVPHSDADPQAAAAAFPPIPPPASPSVRRLARRLNVPLSSITGTGESGRITVEDVRQQSQLLSRSHQTLKVRTSSPRARRIARELGIDWTELQGTGTNGRVREVDVRRAAQNGSAACPASAAKRTPVPMLIDSTTGSSSSASVVGLSTRRRVIADRMRISRDRTVPVTLSAVTDATNLVGLRNQFKNASKQVPSYTDIVVCLVTEILGRHSLLAARWNEDQSALLLPGADGFHIGFAVDTAEGLLVPVIRNVAHLTIFDVATQSRDLIERARAGTLGAADMQGGVFTVTSLGSYGIDAFTPIINYPEIAILGVGAIRREAVVLEDDRIVPTNRITLSLTFDHRAVDGAPAAAFLRDVRTAVENPAPHLLRR